MLFRITHSTHYSYDQPAFQSHNEIRLQPLSGPEQRLLEFSLDIDERASLLEYTDYYGNRVHVLSFDQPHAELIITARSVVERIEQPERTPGEIQFEEFLKRDRERSLAEYDFLNASNYVPFSPALKKFFWMVRPRMNETVEHYARRMIEFVRDQFAYEPGATRVHSTVDEILTIGAGVCQDFAHLMIGVLRLAGMPARYVSGYLAPMGGPRGETWLGAQASHAWVEARIPGSGWVGLDPTNGCLADTRHIRVAIGRDYADVPPIRGTYRSKGGSQVMNIDLRVEPLTGNAQSQGGSSQQ